MEDKLNYLEQPIPRAPVAHAPSRVGASSDYERFSLLHAGRRAEEGQPVSSYVLKMKGYIDNLERLRHPLTLRLGVRLILISLRKEYDGFVQNYNMHIMGKTVNELHAMLKLHDQTLPKSNAPALHAIRAGKVQKGHWKRNCPQYLAELMKKKKNTASGAGGSGIFGLRASRKLKPGALSLYMGNGQREAVEAIGAFYLCLPSGLEIVLNNCHYAPSITRGVIYVSSLYEDGFVNRFVDNTIQLSRNNVVYFSDFPRDGIYEINLSNSLINESSIYAVSNKRAKLDLDSALLWHCRLGHISKKRIEKLQHDGLLNSSDLRVFEKCVSCMSGKMARKPYTYQVERAKDLLRLYTQMYVAHLRSCQDKEKSTSSPSLTTSVVKKTPYEVWHGKAPKLSYALVKRDTLTKPDKLEPRSIKCIFVGYPKETMGYFLYYPPKNKVLVARNAEFLENSLIDQEASGSLEGLENIQEEDMHPSLDTSLNHEKDDLEIDEPQSDIVPIRRSTRTRHASDRMCLYIDADEHELGDLGEPANYKAALLDPESKKWLTAMNVEMQSMKDSEVWVLVELPPNGKTVGNIRAIRILIAIATYYDYEIWQMDVKTAFLNVYLNEELYMEKPEASGSNITFLILYVDDILIMGNNIPMLQSVKTNLGKCFAMKDLAILHGEFQSIPMQEKLKLSKSQELRVSCYTDVGYLTDADDLKSQTGYVFVLNGGAVDWKSAKQSIFATSSAEDEYIAAFDASKEAVWVRNFWAGCGSHN
nr:hypothetical protein [Tanacetum cinerariifolium]